MRINIFKNQFVFLLMDDNFILLGSTNCVQLEVQHYREADSKIKQ